jgi:hypothetical protein
MRHWQKNTKKVKKLTMKNTKIFRKIFFLSIIMLITTKSYCAMPKTQANHEQKKSLEPTELAKQIVLKEHEPVISKKTEARLKEMYDENRELAQKAEIYNKQREDEIEKIEREIQNEPASSILSWFTKKQTVHLKVHNGPVSDVLMDPLEPATALIREFYRKNRVIINDQVEYRRKLIKLTGTVQDFLKNHKIGAIDLLYVSDRYPHSCDYKEYLLPYDAWRKIESVKEFAQHPLGLHFCYQLKKCSL